MIQRITQDFWRSWSGDYLHIFQQRPKWRVVQRLAKIGQIVLVRNPLAPPSQWKLSRITACHPGNDNLTRVVTVKTGRFEYKKPIAKLCFLPVTINSEESKDSVMAGGSGKYLMLPLPRNLNTQLYCVTTFVFCVKAFSSLYHSCILPALMRIISNAYIRGGQYVPELHSVKKVPGIGQ
ncbi:hypothetical protein ALC56_02413 [Trachymyrmex septentrionalis]|uniref:DUF5641 domain-containing protein n=1 Tax=Trachymyrmex septentrionalis TaxID=34720 RepID=A0A195FS02_9HYME|nr:hypothetical protein ALC56_02413 [Trachymyrmex septentrionalis]